jgi:hypothetical protein
MAFKVRFSGQAKSEDYDDDDGFEFLEGGVLAIHFDDESKWSEYHPPAKWEQVTAEPDHLPGLNTPVDDEDDDDYEDDDEDEFEDDEDYEDYDYDDDEDYEDEEPESEPTTQ